LRFLILLDSSGLRVLKERPISGLVGRINHGR
jgi:hypothetical protein